VSGTDGGYVAYSADWTGTSKLYRKAASGAGAEEVLYEPNSPMRMDDLSIPDSFIV
jgi:hypothetical protein